MHIQDNTITSNKKLTIIDDSVKLFPNPSADGVFNLQFRNSHKDITITEFSPEGRLLTYKKLYDITPHTKYQININNYSGLVILSVVLKYHQVNKKLVIKS